MVELEDKTQKVYSKQNKDLDIDRDVEPLAMWAFGVSVAPFVFGWFPIIGALFLFAPVVAIILGIVSLNKIKKMPSKLKGRGFAIAAIVIGAVEIILGVLAIIFFVGAMLAASTV
jgi:uncharacterized membrane protein